ncbi:MAG: DUF4349 domain-containing protein [Hyphomicrobiaceae bacterium]|nr:DUF4349 domain-containing protein [Hyphomicrobiaceae bacterium]
MRLSIARAAVVAAALFFALFLAKLLLTPQRGESDGNFIGMQQSLNQADEKGSRKNYATTRQQSAPPAGVRPPSADTQKYEKIATLSQTTTAYETDRAKVATAIDAHGGLVQIERAAGLKGRRSIYLQIGVPPDKFETFTAALQAIGQGASIDIIKNDKTNEYLELKARRTTLEKARNALEALAATGGSIDERIKLQNRLTEVEEKLQALGVSLGEFDTQNELCTVRLTLTERQPPRGQSFATRAFDALAWTSYVYAGIGLGFLMLTAAFSFAAALLAYVLRIIRAEPATGGTA